MDVATVRHAKVRGFLMTFRLHELYASLHGELAQRPLSFPGDIKTVDKVATTTCNNNSLAIIGNYAATCLDAAGGAVDATGGAVGRFSVELYSYTSCGFLKQTQIKGNSRRKGKNVPKTSVTSETDVIDTVDSPL
ncbi:hypothetical protein VNO77_03099 [Canavalia gladiata]|uniref:Uncharacterized protein n=1 Tax=Canavalia gladiata TaxID=3824 RepID=A0AAN9R7U6_CANGL